MFRIFAYSKFLNLKGSMKLYYLAIIGVFMSVVVFFSYQDVLGAITVLACTLVVYLILSIPPRKITVELNLNSLKIDEEEIEWNKCVCWAMVDLGDVLEFVVQTTQVRQGFYYFYMQEEDAGVKEFILELSQYLPYQEEVSEKNKTHIFLRSLGLK